MTSRSASFPRYGEIWMVALDPLIGAEIGKTRPALIVSTDPNNKNTETVTVLPITSQPPRRQYRVEVQVPAGMGGLTSHSRIKANMIRTLDKSRLRRRLGTLPALYYPQVNQAIRVHLNMV